MDFGPLLAAHPSFAKHSLVPLVAATKGLSGMFRCLVYPSELSWRRDGDGWLFLFTCVSKAQARRNDVVLRTLRAGPSDFAVRAPAFKNLRAKRVAIFGLGAIGAPTAIEMARNGCHELCLNDFDVIDPGNTVRWPLGMSAWGRLKLDAICAFIEREYAATRVILFPHRLGGAFPPEALPTTGKSEDVLSHALEGASLVIDTTAESGINWLLDERCREHSIPLITAHATPTLEAGVVACFFAGDGCRICLEHAWLDGAIPTPKGADAGENALRQPPGCAERTFAGANYDLSEISLQAARLAVDTLASDPQYQPGSCVHMLSFTDEHGQRVPPTWKAFPLRPHPKCQNHPA
jgi:hypothetical protein